MVMINESSLRGDYSPMEQVIFAALLRQQKATSSQLVRKVYAHKGIEPFNAMIVVNKAVITLGQKLKLNREPWRLQRERLPGKRLIANRLVPSKSRSRAHEKKDVIDRRQRARYAASARA